MTSVGFGNWSEDKKQEDGPEGSWFGNFTAPEGLELPLFHSPEAMQNFSFANMKQAMEAQMPKKILGMNYQQRFQVFAGLLLIAALFFALAFLFGLPMIGVRPQKFALSFTMGSLTFMASFGILKGPMEHLKGMCAPDRVVFTSIYIASMIMTLYCTFHYGGFSGYALVLMASGIQLAALLWYLVSFLPGGTLGLQYLVAMLGHLLKPVIVVCAKCQAACCARCFSLWANRG